MPTFFPILEMPDPWPPVVEVRFQFRDLLTITVTAEGRFRLVASLDGGGLEFLSQRVALQPRQRILAIVCWDEQRVELRINRTDILRADATEAVAVISPQEPLPDAPLAIDHTDAHSACSDRMTERAARWGRPSAGPSRRLLSETESLRQLESASEAARSHIAQLRDGRHAFVAPLQGSLRELIVFNGSNFQPLLLRCAARLNLPLPIYAMPDDRDTRPAACNEALFEYRNTLGGLRKTAPGHVLMDLQDWMNGRAYRTGLTTNRDMTVNTLIKELASTSGGGHYDPGIPLALDELAGMTINDTPLLCDFVAHVADVVVELCDYVVGRAQLATSGGDDPTCPPTGSSGR